MSENEYHILIVEDNPDNSQLAEKILNHYGYRTTVMETGEEAINWCRMNQVDLVLMDISLPKKDGLETTRELRQLPCYEEIPIIALTAHAMMGWEEKSKKAGCTDFISKPFRYKQLLEGVKKYLP